VRRTPLPALGDDRFFAELLGCTAEFARIIDGDLDRSVPTCRDGRSGSWPPT